MTITAVQTFPLCPYPEYIEDEVSGVKVKNDKYTLWMAGFVEGLKAGIKTLMAANSARYVDPEIAEQIKKLIGREKMESVEELAQKLYEDDGHCGNLYKQPGGISKKYDDKAAEIIEQHTGYTTDF